MKKNTEIIHQELPRITTENDLLRQLKPATKVYAIADKETEDILTGYVPDRDSLLPMYNKKIHKIVERKDA